MERMEKVKEMIEWVLSLVLSVAEIRVYVGIRSKSLLWIPDNCPIAWQQLVDLFGRQINIMLLYFCHFSSLMSCSCFHLYCFFCSMSWVLLFLSFCWGQTTTVVQCWLPVVMPGASQFFFLFSFYYLLLFFFLYKNFCIHKLVVIELSSIRIEGIYVQDKE